MLDKFNQLDWSHKSCQILILLLLRYMRLKAIVFGSLSDIDFVAVEIHEVESNIWLMGL